MTDEQLAELEALAEKATPGPWEIDDWFGITNPDGDDVGCVDSRESAELIAASRTAIPSLIAEVKRLRTRLECDVAWQMIDGKMTKVSVEPDSMPDGIECRDETIRLQDRRIDELQAEVKRLRAVVSDRASVIEECAAIADLVCKANFMERGGLLVDKIVPRIRALATQQEKDHG